MTAGYRFGPRIGPDGVTFRLWAPGAKQVELVSGERHAMQRSSDGWFTLALSNAGAGTRYSFRIDGDIDVPDPASRFQPDDVHGASEVIVPAYDWQPRDWFGRPWHECVFLEAHVGTFSPEGTYEGLAARLDYVAEAGFTAIELMPLADFSGRWNWGYDGVLLYAPDSVYGRPDDLRRLIDAAHQRNVMVFLDVVYNHFGPEGNYLSRYAPQFFSRQQTPWGDAIDYDVPEVRRFAIENALYWLDEFRFDGLRLDAVHAIAEPQRHKLLSELSEAVGQLASEAGRHVHLVLENDANQTSLLDPKTDPPAGRYRAQWNDDFHHAMHVALTRETTGYYGDYRDLDRLLPRTFAEGFAYQGEPSRHRGGAKRGEGTTNVAATAFVNFLQNHDQIGNRPLGERLTVLAPAEAVEAALAVTLLAPMPPLLFMGEEWGSEQPFPFFCDFKGDLAQAVREGRKREFSDAYAEHGDEIPDPLLAETVEAARLDWSALRQPNHRARLDWVRRLLEARNTIIVPRLSKLIVGSGNASFHQGLLRAAWAFGSNERLAILANLSERPVRSPGWAGGRSIWGGVPPSELPPWAVYVALEQP